MFPLNLLILLFISFSDCGLKETIFTLSKFGSRIPGYEGEKKAREYLIRQFNEIGLSSITVQKFKVASPITKYSYLYYDNKRIKLYPLWPNCVRTPTLPKGGIKGNLVYVGKCSFQELSGKKIKDNFVLVDFNCEQKWMNAVRLDAKAVIFIEPKETNYYEAFQKFFAIPLNIPRFWISRKDFDKLKGTSPYVRIESRVDWENVETANIIGYLEGEKEDELVVIQAYYDSISVVPELAPGGENACGISILLELAKKLKSIRLKRSVMFLATSAHFLNRQGMIDFMEYVKEKELPVKLMLNLELSSQNDELGIFEPRYFLATWTVKQMAPSHLRPFAKRFVKYSKGKLINGLMPPLGKPVESFIPEELCTDSEIGLIHEITTLSFITVYDSRYLIDTPLDLPEKMNIGNLEKQLKLLSNTLITALNDKELLKATKVRLTDHSSVGKCQVVYFDPKKSFVPDEPIPNALGFVLPDRLKKKNALGVRLFHPFITDEEGFFEFFGCKGISGEIDAYYVDSESGEIIYAADRGIMGKEYPLTFSLTKKVNKSLALLFKCKAYDVIDLIDPQYLLHLTHIDVFGPGNVPPTAWGYSFTEAFEWSSYSEPYAVAFVPPDIPVKVIGGSGVLGKRLLLLNSRSSRTKKLAEGEGFLDRISLQTFQMTKDVYNLNEWRIRNLKSYNVENEYLDKRHSLTKKLLESAKDLYRSLNYDGFIKAIRKALGIESRIYPEVKAIDLDVVKGVVFYLFLILPFSFFLERLVFASAHIIKRIIITGAIFLTTYIFIRLVHPGFQLIAGAEIILLGFIIMTLAIIVLTIISSKFEEMMGKIKAGKVTTAEVGRITAMGVAFSLGISNMRKYKTRTLLTSITIVVLTFSILSFTSIKSRLRFTKVKQKGIAPYTGIMIKDRRTIPLEKNGIEWIENEFSDKAYICPRVWYTLATLQNKVYITVKHKDRSIDAYGLLGLSHHEKYLTNIDRCLINGKWLEEEDKDVCIISKELSDYLGVSLAEHVQILGRKFRVKGIFDSKNLKEIKCLDGEMITPCDFSKLSPHEYTEISRARTTELQFKKTSILFPHIEPENTVIIPYKSLLSLGGEIFSIGIKFYEKYIPKVTEIVEDLISRLALTLYVGVNDEIYAYSSMKLTTIGGMSILLIPICIAAFIILNTMLGAVYERQRDIGIFGSLGLAPSHVGMLFLGESCVYALLGAVGGYLLGQILAKVLTELGMLSGLTLNYSSLSCVFSTILAMGVVIASTIYPAKRASEMSVPDVTRKWEIPPPRGDNWEFIFPFTVNKAEILGFFCFLKEFFDSYTEESVGVFYTRGANIGLIGENYFVKTLIWLAPYDLGVKQELTFEGVLTKEFGLYEMKVTINRLEGEVSNWRRLNRRLLNILRKEFLIWRTVKIEIKEKYRELGEKILKK